jgi:16S rRNA (uracil1498-N3)-methyltransferase
MALPRFFSPERISVGQVIELSAVAAHHASRVLRLRQSDELILFDGNGGEYRATIELINKSGVAVMVEKYLDIERESRLDITLAQTVCASEKMDWIVQKGVELGVRRIQPLATKRGVVKLSDERAEKRIRHWQQVIIAACEQCGRNRVPPMMPLISISRWLGSQVGERKNSNSDYPFSSCFMLSPAAKKGLRDFPASLAVAPLTLLVGPEGGFTTEEEAAAEVAGFVPLRLGECILRTETAALAAVAAMQALWGDY